MKLLFSLFILMHIISVRTLKAHSKCKPFKSRKSYAKKNICAGFGKKSSVNRKIKTKRTSGHWKKTGKNRSAIYVNSYSRS